MDDSSFFYDWDESLTKTIALPTQAFGGNQDDVSANFETACKVSLIINFHSGRLILISFYCNTCVA